MQQAQVQKDIHISLYRQSIGLARGKGTSGAPGRHRRDHTDRLGLQYVWIAGQYVQRPAPSANWVPGYWQQGPNGWIWTEGRWA
jgi:hypothetical protein